MAGGSLHHAWLLAGPEGVGKASFATRAARRAAGRGARAAPTISTSPATAPHAADRRRVASRFPRARAPAQGRRRSPSRTRAQRSPIAQVRALAADVRDHAVACRRAASCVIDCDRRSRARRRQRAAQEPGGAAGGHDLPAGQPCAGAAAADDPLALPAAAVRAAGRRRRCARCCATQLPDADADEIAALVARGAGLARARAALRRARPRRRSTPRWPRSRATATRATRGASRLAKALALKAAQPRYEAFLDRAPAFIADARARRGGRRRCAPRSTPMTRRAISPRSALGLSLDAQGDGVRNGRDRRARWRNPR